jgi:hypothetical protein
MKRIILLSVVLVTALVALEGCWVWWDDGGWHGHDRGGRHEERHENRR